LTTSFLSVYASAIAEIDDPNLTYIFNQNPTSPIQFYKVLYQFLNNTWPLFNNPISEINVLTPQNSPSGYLETFTGGSTNYHLSTTPLSNSYFEYKISGSVVSGSYNPTTGCATIIGTSGSSDLVSVEWYFPGEFINDISPLEIVILGKGFIYQWGEKEKNYQSDIRRALMDTDFKMTSEGVIMRGKGDLWLNMRDDFYQKMNQFAMNQALYQYSGGRGFRMG
jgi:hypothetical protein